MLSPHVNSTNNSFPFRSAAPLNRWKRPKKWDCALPEMIIGEYLVSALTSVKMLKSEAYWMSNCCQEYARQCADHEYCLFSIRRRTGERLATLGLERTEGYWRFDQCFGPSNCEVIEERWEYYDEENVLQTEWRPSELFYVAHEVARLLNGAGSGYGASRTDRIVTEKSVFV